MRALAALLLAAAALLSAGCATVPAAGDGKPPVAANPADPWENWNRKVFAFNDAIDDAVVRPAAEGYRKAVPELMRTGVTNFFGNIGDVWSTANQFLQGKVQYGFEMGMRVIVNTLFGLGGILDPATEMKLVKRPEDFGQTLGRWGVGSGPYVVLPLFGPSTLRDAPALVVDRAAASASRLAETDAGAYSITALELLNTRSNLLQTTQLLGEVALDRYSFVRDAYLARRLDQVYDGAPPLETFDDEPAEAPKKP